MQQSTDYTEEVHQEAQQYARAKLAHAAFLTRRLYDLKHEAVLFDYQTHKHKEQAGGRLRSPLRFPSGLAGGPLQSIR